MDECFPKTPKRLQLSGKVHEISLATGFHYWRNWNRWGCRLQQLFGSLCLVAGSLDEQLDATGRCDLHLPPTVGAAPSNRITIQRCNGNSPAPFVSCMTSRPSLRFVHESCKSYATQSKNGSTMHRFYLSDRKWFFFFLVTLLLWRTYRFLWNHHRTVWLSSLWMETFCWKT